MDVLLLAGYRKDETALGLSATGDGLILIDQQIKTLREMGLSPIVVLAGIESDDVLRKSKSLSGCELIFDTNGSDSTLTTGIRAGLHGVSHTCFALPVEIPCPEKEVWIQLKKSFLSTGFSTKIAILQLVDKEGAPWHWGFPLFFTRLGRHLLLNEESITQLTDPQLKYGYHTYIPPEGLAVNSPSL